MARASAATIERWKQEQAAKAEQQEQHKPDMSDTQEQTVDKTLSALKEMAAYSGNIDLDMLQMKLDGINDVLDEIMEKLERIRKAA